MRNRVLPILLGMCAALSAALAWLGLLFLGLCGCSPLMLALIRRLAPPSITLLPAGEYAPVVEKLTRYLMGLADTCQHSFTVEGSTFLCFHPYELTHLADIRLWMGRLQVLTPCCALMAVLFCCHSWRNMPRFRRSMGNTFLSLLGIIAALGLWGAVDFDSLFIAFHRLLFTNDLWLLNPQTDLLIRLMPLPLFIIYGSLLGVLTVGGLLLGWWVCCRKT